MENHREIKVFVENEKELENFFNIAQLARIIYFKEIYFGADRYFIDPTLIKEEIYGPFREKVLLHVDERNQEVEKLRDKIIGIRLFFLFNGTVHNTLFLKEEMMFSYPNDFLNDLEIEIDGLYDYVHTKRAGELMSEETRKMELFAKLQEHLFEDEVFLCANKGAKMLRMKEIAYEIGLNEILTMTKVDLENYSDLMMTKNKIEKSQTKE